MLITCSVSSSELTTDTLGSSEVPALVEPRVPVQRMENKQIHTNKQHVSVAVSAAKQFCRMMLRWLVEGGHV